MGSSHHLEDCVVIMRRWASKFFIHMRDILENGASPHITRTVDTTVLAILLGKFQTFLALNSSADTVKDFTHYHVDALCQSLGPSKSLALLIFHNLTGCDTTLIFNGSGKKKSLEA